MPPVNKRLKRTVNRAARVVIPWVEHYLQKGRNATAASLAVGVTKKNATKFGVRMMKRPDVRKLLEERCAQVTEQLQAKTLLTVEEVLRDLAVAARFDKRRLYNKDGSMKHPLELSYEDARQIEEIEMEEVHLGRGKKKVKARLAKVKLAKTTAVRDQAMRHFGLYAKDNPNVADPDELAAAVRARLRQMDNTTDGDDK